MIVQEQAMLVASSMISHLQRRFVGENHLVTKCSRVKRYAHGALGPTARICCARTIGT